MEYKVDRITELFKKSVILPIIIAFFILNLASRQDGATNEMSRFATLRAMAEQGTFKINDYKDWTVDWAQTPDGNFYSNKAPGAMLLAYPVFFPLDYFAKYDRKQVFKNGNKIGKITATPRVIISLLFQMVPFSLICLLLFEWGKKSGYGVNSIIFSSFAIIFANTAAVFMNFYFGHALTAIFILCLTYSYIKRRFDYMGLFFGLALLNDYSVAFILPILVFTIIYNEKNLTWLRSFLLGGIIPGILWIWYHVACFGSPFKIPNMYQNPIFQDVKTSNSNLWGIFNLNLDATNYLKLLFGQERGVLFTQPWLLLTLIQGLFLYLKRKLNSLESWIFVISFLSFIALLFMNAQFRGWHGGGTSGPRYLSIIFPLIGFLGMFVFQKSNRFIKFGLISTLIFSLVFRALIYGSRATAINGNDLWPYLYEDMLSKPNGKGIIKFVLFCILLIITLWITKRRSKQNSI